MKKLKKYLPLIPAVLIVVLIIAGIGGCMAGLQGYTDEESGGSASDRNTYPER